MGVVPLLRTRMHTAGWLAVIAASLLVLSAAGPAVAQEPRSVQRPLTDAAGVASGAEEAEIERTLEAARGRGIDLHALFVDGASGPATSYAEDVARASSMGGDDALLVIAFSDRSYALWTGVALDISPAEAEAILDGLVAPALRRGDIPSAVEGAARGVLEARSGNSGGSDGGRSRGGIPLLPIVLVGLLLLFFGRRMSSRRRTWNEASFELPDAQPAIDLAAMSAETNALLLRVDDQLRDAEHESGFAEAQYGTEEGAAMESGLKRARAELQQAFALRQQLDDGTPESPQEQAALLEGVTAHARAAESIVGEHLQRIEELRGLERDPAAAIAELGTRRDQVEQRIPAVESSIAELRVTAPDLAVAVDGNPAEARKRVAFLDEQLEAARDEATPDLARALRAGGAALAQAEQLLDAADDLVSRVREARASLPQELQEAELALARAEDLVRSRRHVVGREARTRVVEARRRYDHARTLATRDPAAAAQEADTAEQLADEAFELGLRDGDEYGGGDDGYGGSGGGVSGFGWGMPIPIPIPFPMGGGIGWGGSSWGGGGFGGSVGGGSFGGGSVGGGRW